MSHGYDNRKDYKKLIIIQVMTNGLFSRLREEIKEKYGLTKRSINFVPFEDWRKKLQTYPIEFSEEYTTNLEFLKRKLRLANLPRVNNKDKKLILFVGIPGSGKTTLVKIVAESVPNTIFLRGHDIVDMLHLYKENVELYRKRLKVRGFEHPDPWYISYLYQEQLTSDCLNLGYNVVFDDNIRTRVNRMGYHKLARNCHAGVVFIEIDTPFETCVRRTTKREEDKYEASDKNVRFIANFAFQGEDISERERKKYDDIIVIDGTKSPRDIKREFASRLR